MRTPLLSALLLASVCLTITGAGAPSAAHSRPALPHAALVSAPPQAGSAPAGTATGSRGDPRRTRPLHVDPYAQAATHGPAFRRIAREAQPFWATDPTRSPTETRKAVRQYVERARAAKATPLVVAYNVPDRDCGRYSSPDDDITDAYYRRWIAEVAAAVRGSRAIVLLEPDSIAFVDDPACSGRGDRLALLRNAVSRLARAGAWVYLDGGHSAWRSASEMAALMRRAGIAKARGFSTNVANTRATAAERTYANRVRRELGRLGVRNVHWVLDTSRNGAGARGPAVGDWCNATAARLGARPRLVFDGAFDGRLWVKPPGESDGECNGGPPAGQWFPDGACRLMGLRGYDEAAARCR